MYQFSSIEADLAQHIVDQHCQGFSVEELQTLLIPLLAPNGNHIAGEIGQLFDPRVQKEKQPFDREKLRVQIVGVLGLHLSERRRQREWKDSSNSLLLQFDLDQ